MATVSESSGAYNHCDENVCSLTVGTDPNDCDASVTATGNAPAIIDWCNDKTKDNSSAVTINESEYVHFNATADQPIDVWSWFVNGTNQTHNFDNFTYCDWTINGTYYVKINATNANGTSSPITWTVTVNDITAPAKVQSLTNGTPTVTTVDLWWTANTEPDLIGYKVYQNGSSLGTTTSTFYNVTGLSPNTTYEFNVSAYDDNNLEGENATVTVTTAAYAAPTITDWYNSKTKNNSTAITINESECVYFNATADQPIDVWSWFVNGTNQTHNFDNFSYCGWTVNGTYYVEVNVANVNGTSNTLNGTVTVIASVVMPDLVITEKSEAWADLENRTYNVTYTVKNIGNTDANESTTSILIDGIEAANDSVGTLAPLATHTAEFGPFTMSDENDTVRICADNESAVEESNETNNCLENEFEHPGAGCLAEDGTLFKCGDTVTKSCTFNGNMSCESGRGLIIGANDITIDGNGYKIMGNREGLSCGGEESSPAAHSGIVNTGYDNVVIKNLEIEHFCTGIVLGGYPPVVDDNTVTICKIHDCGNSTARTHGIHIVGANNCTIVKNEIYNIDGDGIESGCGGGGNGIFMYGVSADRGNYNNITCNSLYDNIKSGFFMKYQCMHNTISNNTATGNGEGGIVLMCKKSNYNIIEGNNASENVYDGIYIGGRNNTLRNNSVFNNGFIGIDMERSDGSYNNELYENTVCGNGYTDISTCGPSCYGNHGANNTCDTTSYYGDEGTTGCTYDCSPAPDLVITEMYEEWVNLVNNTYNITYTVKNIGDADAGTSTTSIVIDEAEVATDSAPGLASGASHTNEIGPFTMSGGSDTIRVSADRDNVVLEKSREYNNYLENIFRHPEMPDLTITAKSEAWIVEGSSYNITYTIKNIGDETAGASTSTTSIKIDGAEVATDSVKALNASESYTSTLGPFTMSGNSDRILICADCENSVTENNEENNCKENVLAYSGDGSDGDGDSTCSDGTPYGGCSVNKPKYCNNGILIDDCVRCRCPEGQTCDVTSGSCYVPGEGACIGATKTFICGDTVTESCTLNGTMGCPAGHGLIIGADGITIDGTGYKILGDKAAEACAGSVETGPGGGAEVSIYCGICNKGYDAVTITNLEIENFCTGIGLFGSGANIVENNKITDCIIHDNGLSTPFGVMDMVTHGIHASYMKHLEITGNDIYNNEGTGDSCGAGGNGIFIYAGVSENYCDISHNKLHDNAKAGFWTKMKLSQSTISHNDVYGNGNGAGIADDVRGGIVLRCKLSRENLIAYNDVHDHDADGYGYGIYVGGGSNTIEHNTVTGNSRHGISMARSDGSFNNELYNNLVCDNGVDIGVTSGVTGNIGDDNTCDTTNNYDDDGTTGCTYSCPTSSEEESGGTGESEEERIEESKEISFIAAGANASISFNETNITSITIYVKNDVANVSINVQQFDEPPANITNLTGVSHRCYMNITASNITDADLINATVRFDVNRSWIVDESIDEGTIRLNRYNDTNGNWTVLPTTKINETENNATIYFEAITPGFSLFSITGEQKIRMVIAETTPAPTSTQIADEAVNGESIWIPKMPAETSTPVEMQTEVSWSIILLILIASLSVILIASVISRRRKR